MDDKNIVEGLKNGDPKTINHIYNDYRNIAYSISKKYNFDSLEIEQDIKDIFQETMYVIIKMVNKDDFKLGSKFSTLFYGIYKRQALKHYQNNKRIDKEEEFDFSKLVDKFSYFDKDSVEFLKLCLDGLSENRRTILEMYYIEGYNMQEISDKLGMSGSDSVKSQKYKAFKKLETIMKARFSKEEILA